MNLDSVFSALAPKWALKRARARFELLSYNRAYAAAKVGRNNGGWIATGTSANAELSGALTTVRNRLRSLLRDDEWASSAVKKTVAYTVGTGINVSPKNNAERKKWRQWAKSTRCDWDGIQNFAGIQKLVVHALHETGEVLIRRRIAPDRLPGEIPLQLQVLEVDHLDESKNGPMENGTFAILGVKFDAQGKRIGYYLFPNHPGDVLLTMSGTLQSQFVSADEIIHVFDRTRPEQVRGMSRLAVAVARLKDMADYQHALLVKKKIEACFVMHIASENPQAVGDLTGATTGAHKHESMRPGMIMYGSQGETVSFGMPTSTADEGYTKTQLHAISAGTGVPYYMLTGDLESVNYTSSRAGKIDFHMMIEQDQWLIIVPQFLTRVREWWRTMAVIAGAQIGADEDTYTMPKRHYTDPLKDIQAHLAAIEGNAETLSQVIRETGREPEEVFAERAAEQKALIGLDLAVDPAAEKTGVESNAPQSKKSQAAKAARLLAELMASGDMDE